MNSQRRCFFALLAICAVFLTPTSSNAAYPERPVRFLVGYLPGGGVDIVARAVSQKLSETLGQPVVIENRPGADGSIAASTVAQASPDGYLFLVTPNSLTIKPTDYSVAYDPVRAFSPITLIAEAPSVYVVKSTFPAKSLKEFVALAKSKPGQLNYGSVGPGSGQNLSLALIMKANGIDLVHIPFKGGPALIPALLVDDIHITRLVMSTAIAPLKSGQLRALAVSSRNRSPLFPEVPSVVEVANVPPHPEWIGILGPRNTPRDIVNKLSRDIIDVVRSPDVEKRLLDLGWTVTGNTPEEFSEIIKSEVIRWGAVMESIKPK